MVQRFELALPSGYRTVDCLRFLARDSQAVSERVSEHGFEKAFLHAGQPFVLRAAFQSGTAHCESDCADVTAASTIARRLLGLHSLTADFERQFSNDSLLGDLLERQRGLHTPLSATPWEGIAWAIAGQQITLQFAIALRRAMILAFGTKHRSGLFAHPSPETIAQVAPADLRSLKFSVAKADYLLGAARALLDGLLAEELPFGEMHSKLSAIRGFGPWTVQYVMLRALGYADCLPASDAGLAQGLQRLPAVGRRLSARQIQVLMERFAPYRSLATCHVWASL